MRKETETPECVQATHALGLPGGKVLLLEAHDAWADLFRIEKARIVAAIGMHILDVQHVGSTSIPGVPAKPILDIFVCVEDFHKASVCVAPMQEMGYRYRQEYGIPRRHYFVKGNPRTHHLHVVERNSRAWLTAIDFRDFLKGDPVAARAYAEEKTRLAKKHVNDRPGYQRSKDAIVERLLGMTGIGCIDR